jgi:hypothetical protein
MRDQASELGLVAKGKSAVHSPIHLIMERNSLNREALIDSAPD